MMHWLVIYEMELSYKISGKILYNYNLYYKRGREKKGVIGIGNHGEITSFPVYYKNKCLQRFILPYANKVKKIRGEPSVLPSNGAACQLQMDSLQYHTQEILPNCHNPADCRMIVFFLLILIGKLHTSPFFGCNFFSR